MTDYNPCQVSQCVHMCAEAQAQTLLSNLRTPSSHSGLGDMECPTLQHAMSDGRFPSLLRSHARVHYETSTLTVTDQP